MGLTLVAEQRLNAVGLVAFFKKDEANWQELAQHTCDYLRGNFPKGDLIRRDDVANAMRPVLEVHEKFLQFRNERKLTQKYWISDFADLIMDRVWDSLNRKDK